MCNNNKAALKIANPGEYLKQFNKFATSEKVRLEETFQYF